MKPRLCACGCGEPAPLAAQSSTRRGWIKGEPLRYIAGHNFRVPLSPQERFLVKVDKQDGDGCWLWTAFTHPVTGYGFFYFNGRTMHAHRAAYEMYVGPIPEGLQIDHLCRVRRCVRPDHMEPVTQAENMRRGMAPGMIVRREDKCRRGHSLIGAPVNERGTRICRECERINREKTRSRKFGTEPPSHGNRYAYVTYGCRCDECRAASARYNAELRARKAMAS